MFRFIILFLFSQLRRNEALQMYKIIICLQVLVIKNEVWFLKLLFLQSKPLSCM